MLLLFRPSQTCALRAPLARDGGNYVSDNMGERSEITFGRRPISVSSVSALTNLAAKLSAFQEWIISLDPPKTPINFPETVRVIRPSPADLNRARIVVNVKTPQREPDATHILYANYLFTSITYRLHFTQPIHIPVPIPSR